MMTRLRSKSEVVNVSFRFWNLPSPLFGAVANYFEALKTGKRYFEIQQ